VNDRLYRSVDDRILAGVCAGLADRLGVDPALVRIAWVLLTLASNGVFLVIYIVMAFVVPEEDDVMAFPPMPPGTTMTPPAGMSSAGETGAATPAADAANLAAPVPGAPGMPPAPAQSGWVMPQSSSQWRAQARAERRAARAARRAEGKPGQASLVLGVILILLGGWFLLEQYVPAFDAGRFWPFIVIVLGVVLLAFAFRGRPSDKPEGQP
jgi:phage shock protein PspC (stress-responsive transcriptional regulator)